MHCFMKMQHPDNYFSLVLLDVFALVGIFKVFFALSHTKPKNRGELIPSFAKVSANAATMF